MNKARLEYSVKEGTETITTEIEGCCAIKPYERTTYSKNSQRIAERMYGKLLRHLKGKKNVVYGVCNQIQRMHFFHLVGQDTSIIIDLKFSNIMAVDGITGLTVDIASGSDIADIITEIQEVAPELSVPEKSRSK